MLSEDDFREKAERTLCSVGPVLKKAPSVVPLMTCALAFALSDPTHIVICGPPTREDTKNILRSVHGVYLSKYIKKKS